MKFFNNSSSNRTARTRFILEAMHDSEAKKCKHDTLYEFQHTEQLEVYETIKAGNGITVNPDTNNKLVISLADLSGAAGTYVAPASMTVDVNGRVTSVKPGIQPDFPFTAVPGFDSVTFLTPTSIVAHAAPEAKWKGRWTMKQTFMQPFRMSFNITPGISLVGISSTKSLTDTKIDATFAKFSAAFYFELPKSFCVLDKAVPNGLRRIGTWDIGDRFSILFNGRNFLYYQNGIKVYTEKTVSRGPLYVAGCFRTKSDEPQAITNLSVQEVFSAAEEATVIHPTMKCLNGIPMVLCKEPITLLSTRVSTTIPGNICMWGSVNASGPLILELVINGSEKETSVRFESDGNSSVFHGTDEHFPPALYTITLTAIPRCSNDSDSDDDDSQEVSVDTSRMMVVTHLL